MSDEQPFLVLNVPDREPIVLETAAKAMQWQNDQRQAWEQLKQPNGNYPELDRLIGECFSAIYSKLDQGLGNPGHPDYLRDAKSKMDEWFVSRRLPLRDSPEFAYLEKVKAEQPHLLDNAVDYFSKRVTPTSNDSQAHTIRQRYLQAAVGAIISTDLGLPLPEAIIGAMKDQWATANSEFAKLQNDYGNKIKNAQAEINALQKTFSEEKTRFDDEFTRHEANRSKHEEQMKEIARRFHESMAIRAPVEYWQKRSTRYHQSAKKWGWWATAVGGISAVIILAMHMGVSWWIAQCHAPSMETSAGVLRHWLNSFSTTGVVAFFLSWATRILVRNYLSAIHLATDASEREVIVQTYPVAAQRTGAGREQRTEGPSPSVRATAHLPPQLRRHHQGRCLAWASGRTRLHRSVSYGGKAVVSACLWHDRCQ
jgi:hypothetical protein